MAADIGYGKNAFFREGLTAAGWWYVVAAKGSPCAYLRGVVPRARPYGGLGPAPRAACPHPAASLGQQAIAHAADVVPVTWRKGSKASNGNPAVRMTSYFLAILVRPASRHVAREADRSFSTSWLLAEWPPEADEPSGYWLATLPEDPPVVELVRLA
jgi:DDE superfamily endonuclease